MRTNLVVAAVSAAVALFIGLLKCTDGSWDMTWSQFFGSTAANFAGFTVLYHWWKNPVESPSNKNPHLLGTVVFTLAVMIATFTFHEELAYLKTLGVDKVSHLWDLYGFDIPSIPWFNAEK